MTLRVMRWPSPHRFAFGITDDPDQSRTPRVRAIYDECACHGISPTRGLWVTAPNRECGLVNQTPPDDGVTLEDEDHLELCRELQTRGIEMSWHGASSGNNTRTESVEALEHFERTLGAAPRLITFHSHNAENVHWGAGSFRPGFIRWIAGALVPRKTERFEGDDPESPYGWSDVVRERFDYARLYRTLNVDVLRVNPSMPYHSPSRPDIRFWFSATAQDLNALRRINKRSVRKLRKRDGLCMLYAHLAEKLVDDNGNVIPEAKRVFSLIGDQDDCWCSGASAILDRLRAIKNLVIREQRAGIVIANPTPIDLHDLQIRTSHSTLYNSNGEELERNEHGLFVLPELPGGATRALYPTRDLAWISDPKGISVFERARLVLEETRRILALRALYRGPRKSGIPIETLRSVKNGTNNHEPPFVRTNHLHQPGSSRSDPIPNRAD